MNNTNTEQKYTATPWIESPHSYGDALVLGANGNHVISLMDDGACGDPDCCGSPTYRIHMSAADLRYMLRACNAHPQLVDALGDLIKVIELTGGDPTQRGLMDAALSTARAALLAARGGK